MFLSTKHKSVFIISGIAIGVLLATAINALADSDPTTDTVPRMIPYQGTLEMNGQAVHAVGENAIPMQFDLYSSENAETPVYSQRMNIEVFAGRFTALLGPTGEDDIPIAEVVRAADDLHLGMILLKDPLVDEDDIVLNNRQRILATPYAMWATSTTNLTVGGNITLEGGNINGVTTITPQGGALTINSNLSLNGGNLQNITVINDSGQSTAIGGGLEVRGSDFVLGTDDGRDKGSRTAQRALVHDANDELAINYAEDFEGGTRIDGTVKVNHSGQTDVLNHYHLSSTSLGSTIPVDMDKFTQLCGDKDGCRVRLGMTKWSSNAQTAAASRELICYYADSNKRWRCSNDVVSYDDNGTTNHLLNIWGTCFLTDGTYQNWVDQGDNAPGFNLLVWNGTEGNHTNPNRTCELTLID